jgi:ATP-dependent DNA ligase
MKTFEPMEARSVTTIPTGDAWQYEPKWDGFRALLSRRKAKVSLLSKSGQDLSRYFPEIVAAALEQTAEDFLVDGELLVTDGDAFFFDRLSQRIHPAASRIAKLAGETPATLFVFDLLRHDDRDISRLKLAERRGILESIFDDAFPGDGFRLSPASRDLEQARQWLALAGGGTDGVIAKRLDLPYMGGTRDGMQKIKRIRSADCVIGGFRYATREQAGRQVVGSLLLGLYDDAGRLHHVGFTSGLKAAEKIALTERLESIRTTSSFEVTVPGGPSRWSNDRSSEWVAVKPKFVVEVSFDQVTGQRFRHGTKILRWRSDKSPRQCTFEQLAQTAASQASATMVGQL